MDVVEWWPDYGGALLHLRTGAGGTPIELATLGLSDGLVARLRSWVGRYDDDKLPVDGGAGDPAWSAEGTELLAVLRRELAPRSTVVVTEPWWGEEPTE